MLKSALSPAGFFRQGPHMQFVLGRQAPAIGRPHVVEQVSLELGRPLGGKVLDRHQLEAAVSLRLVEDRLGLLDVDGVGLDLVHADVMDTHRAPHRVVGAGDGGVAFADRLLDIGEAVVGGADVVGQRIAGRGGDLRGAGKEQKRTGSRGRPRMRTCAW